MSADLFASLFSNLWSIFLIILFFGGSIFVHELGHFLAARRRGLHVERFSIGFGPKIFSWNRNGVEYRLSWLPLGGYVALPQLADMSGIEGDSKADAARLPPISYASKMIVAVMGAVFNMLFAFLLAVLIWMVGQPSSTDQTTTRIGAVLPTVELAGGEAVPGPAAEAGLQPGDVVLQIDGRRVSTWPELAQTLYAGSGRSPAGDPQAVFTVERNGQVLNLTVRPRLAGEDRLRQVGILPAEELIVHETMPGSPAEAAGLRAADRIVAVDGAPIYQVEAFRRHLMENHHRPIAVEVERESGRRVLYVEPRLETTESGQTVARAGFAFRSSYQLIHPNPVRQIRDHSSMIFRVLGGLLNPRSDLGVAHLSGPPGIARVFHMTAQIDIRLVIWFTILVNVNLAILNLLPIPVLDGGHMLFATVARLRGRALPPNLIAATQSLFMILLFSLMLYVSFFDIRRWVRDAQADAVPTAESAPAAPADR